MAARLNGMNRSVVLVGLTRLGRRRKRCITYTSARSDSAILSGMTANQRPVSVKSFCFRRTIVPDGRTIAAHIPLLLSAEAGTENVCHARPSVVETG
jgi:hypothetical protein